jgi:hypothetical protein
MLSAMVESDAKPPGADLVATRRRRQRLAAIVLAILFLLAAVVGAVMASSVPSPGCFEWCGMEAAYGRFVLGFAVGGLALAAGTWRGNLFCMGIALFLFALGVLIAGIFVLMILVSGRNQVTALIPILVAVVFATPVAALSLALFAQMTEGQGGG